MLGRFALAGAGAGQRSHRSEGTSARAGHYSLDFNGRSNPAQGATHTVTHTAVARCACATPPRGFDPEAGGREK